MVSRFNRQTKDDPVLLAPGWNDVFDAQVGKSRGFTCCWTTWYSL